MYFSFDKNKILEDYPFLKDNYKNKCLVHFISLDLVARTPFDLALKSFYEDINKSIMDNCFKGKVNKGNVVPYARNNPFIVQIPCSEKYTDKFNEDYVSEGLNKLFYLLNNNSLFSDVEEFIFISENVDVLVVDNYMKINNHTNYKIK